ncbi:hypothetical protein [Candidatus Vampirococcus lugosii]|uniref:Uncharacterized protein n=1 Tax=Candidatus Vampirococcus lugosii TaxID=2789015 RepID=A0ABS5QMI6_9BACT|nr:hypothetical protein [Candidatus Vampirococcus lugosii]MBS8121973.1 hypothetical protein [Candidatus Vampirococcus lugosii]
MNESGNGTENETLLKQKLEELKIEEKKILEEIRSLKKEKDDLGGDPVLKDFYDKKIENNISRYNKLNIVFEKIQNQLTNNIDDLIRNTQNDLINSLTAGPIKFVKNKNKNTGSLKDENGNDIKSFLGEDINGKNVELITHNGQNYSIVKGKSGNEFRLVNLDKGCFISNWYDSISFDHTTGLFIVDNGTGNSNSLITSTYGVGKKYMTIDGKILGDVDSSKIGCDEGGVFYEDKFKYSLSNNRFESNDDYEIINPESQKQGFLFVRSSVLSSQDNKIYVLKLKSGTTFGGDKIGNEFDEILSDIKDFGGEKYVKVRDGENISWLNLNTSEMIGIDLIEVEQVKQIGDDWIFKAKQGNDKYVLINLKTGKIINFLEKGEGDEIGDIEEIGGMKYIKVRNGEKYFYINFDTKEIIGSGFDEIGKIIQVKIKNEDKLIFRGENGNLANYYDANTGKSLIQDKFCGLISSGEGLKSLSGKIDKLNNKDIIYFQNGRKYFDLETGEVKKSPKQEKVEQEVAEKSKSEGWLNKGWKNFKKKRNETNILG